MAIINLLNRSYTFQVCNRELNLETPRNAPDSIRRIALAVFKGWVFLIASPVILAEIAAFSLCRAIAREAALGSIFGRIRN